MESRSLKYVAEACGGELVQGSPNTNVSRVCTDSRQAQAGDLFVALMGEKFDAHTFLPDVAKRNATAVVAEKAKLPGALAGCGVIAVQNTRQALGQLAARYRADFDLPVIAVGGSNGKTTTKELIAAVLRQKFPTLWSEASFNNDIGVPLTLLKLERTHKAAVLEVGTNHPGELAPLLQMIRPRYSVITSIGREHLEFFGGMDGVVKEEGTLAESLPANGKLFVNGESEWIKPILKRARATVVKVGWTGKNDLCADKIRMDETGVAFVVHASSESLSGEYRINLIGRHQVLNALLAIGVGGTLGLSRAEIQRGLAEAKPAKMRMQVWTVNDVRVLDDTYNANTDSMLAALQTLRDLPCSGRRVAVLGDMAELGEHSAKSHAEVGKCAAEVKVSHLFAVGKMAGEMAKAARKAGLKKVTEVAEVEQAGKALKEFLKPGDVVLLKASRATRLERVGEVLRGAQEL